jgi:hypothetical protein
MFMMKGELSVAAIVPSAKISAISLKKRTRDEEEIMSTLTPHELEGRLNAHRELLIELLSA